MASDNFFFTLCPDQLYMGLLCMDRGCEKAIEEIQNRLRPPLNPESSILLLLGAKGWRSHLVGAVASLLYEPTPEVIRALWCTFDAGSWVSPQLAVSAFNLDPRFSAEARVRIEREFVGIIPAAPRPTFGERLRGATSPLLRWQSNVQAKGIAALFYLCGLNGEHNSWFTIFRQDAGVLRAVESYGEGGDLYAGNWLMRLNRLGLPRKFQSE